MSKPPALGESSSCHVVHVPFGYLPDTLGGTEIYVAGLVNELTKLGLSSAVVASGPSAEYTHDATQVLRIPPSPALRLEALYGEGDEGAAARFGTALDSVKPQIVHFHAFTSGASLLAIVATTSAKSLGRLAPRLQRSFWMMTSSAVGSQASTSGMI